MLHLQLQVDISLQDVLYCQILWCNFTLTHGGRLQVQLQLMSTPRDLPSGTMHLADGLDRLDIRFIVLLDLNRT